MFKLVITLTLVSFALAQFKPARTRHYESIIRQRQEIDPIGSYNWQFETENGIIANEQGRLRPIPSGPGRSQQEALRAEGEFKYTSPEGIPVYVSYVADEEGYQPLSDVIPTPPPIPDYIIRSLEWQRNHPEPVSKNVRRF